MARIIIKERGCETRSMGVKDGRLRVGRSGQNDIVMQNRYASAEHCEIICENGECTVSDLDSTNGLFVNGQKVKSRKLEDNDRVFVGAGLLIYIADEEAVQLEKLLAQLKKGSVDERELAANLLGQLGGAGIAGPLVVALKEDPESRVKAAAAEALGLLGDAKSMKTLVACFDTSDALLRKAVVSALIRLADDKTVDGVAGFLRHEDRKVRILAAHTLGQTCNTRATRHLLRALNDEAFAVREAVVKALGDIADPDALDSLMQAVDDDARFPRLWVVDSLGKIRNPAATPALIKALGDSNAAVREASVEALGKVRAKEAVPALIAALGDADASVRRSASVSLEKLRKHIEVEEKLSASGGERETLEISSIGDDRERETGSEPLYGEDAAGWRQWWAEKER